MLGVITVLAQNGVADLLAAGEAHADAGRSLCWRTCDQCRGSQAGMFKLFFIEQRGLYYIYYIIIRIIFRTIRFIKNFQMLHNNSQGLEIPDINPRKKKTKYPPPQF
jgi:hypothetical protein